MCDTPVWQGVNLHMDHVIPIAPPHNGLHCADNLRPACADCNLSKGSRLMESSPALKLNGADLRMVR